MVFDRKRFAVLVTIALATLIGASGPQSCMQTPYIATVRWTSYGIPHVRASNWGSLGYGYGFAFARDNLCVLASDVVEANGELSRYFGPGSGNLQSDFVWALYNSDAVAQSSWDRLDGDSQELLRGYARGYNRFLTDIKVTKPTDQTHTIELPSLFFKTANKHHVTIKFFHFLGRCLRLGIVFGRFLLCSHVKALRICYKPIKK